jgi:hypothetical protein
MLPATVRRSPCAALLAATLLLVIAPAAMPAPGGRSSAEDSDSLYSARHPRLLFSRDELPAWRSKVQDGGRDDDAYGFIHNLVDSLYPVSSLGELMGQTFGMHVLIGTGLVCHFDDPPDLAARELGRALTIAVADSFAADDNTFFSPVRLRILCWGYDMCMDTATPSERAYVRGEIESYVDSLMLAFNYERWLHPPYVSNLSAMIGSALGLAAICLSDEMAPARVEAALARADTFVTTWRRHQLDPGGSCREGVQYGAWSMHHLSAYFFARKRYDGMDFAKDPAIRGIEEWLAHELLPEPGAFVNNLNDTAYLNHPLSRHNSYVDWAMTAWSSGLAAWLWERILGVYGYDWGLNVDRAATVLWWQPIAPHPPARSVPRAVLWWDRGLYSYRTGWPADGASDDLVFSFYSGRFHGGHAQQDQNSFTLYAFGKRFAADNGFDATNWRSEAHNMIFIDGAGQHYAGTTYGTDGRIAAHILGGYADYLLGDATAAYTTHSPYNNPGVPFPDDDWSAGYRGANPVEYAHRRWIVVHDGATPPYLILHDDIRKDGSLRTYDWRMHTEVTHTVDVAPALIRITAQNGATLEMDLLAPDSGAPSVRTETFANPSSDPDTRVLVLSETADRGRFALVMRPAGPGEAAPAVTRFPAAWGGAEILAWAAGPVDVVLANADRDTVVVNGPATITTDARVAQLRFSDARLTNGVLVDATTCDTGAIPLLRSTGEPLSLVIDGNAIHVDPPDAAFALYAPQATAVLVDGKPVPFTRDGDFVRRGPGTPARTPASLGVAAYPVPFAAGLTVAIDSPGAAPGEAVVYDVRGRRVRRIWEGTLVGGRTLVAWDGNDDSGSPVPSGVYFLRASAGSGSAVRKIVRIR